ncbi:hypothetical protein AVEN_148621-1 [Araneus ventricosus]|uniref:Uncharacterized protein n=1 Tax=Araneus ventricosus TaxID=182803 RepID=A0A4Y2UP86_ARAVE|nr:hypothetical protein AVEN_109541-1 [Araneus ventricosus]GBO14691.1 hypothetical protein AVEN_148621-1 [Araneus ventricosus]
MKKHDCYFGTELVHLNGYQMIAPELIPPLQTSIPHYSLCKENRRLKVTRFSHSPHFPPLRYHGFGKSCVSPHASTFRYERESRKLSKLLNCRVKKEWSCCLPHRCQGNEVEDVTLRRLYCLHKL